MNNETTKRYSLEEFKAFNFYQMPRFLFQDIYKEKLNSNCRIVYMMLLNHFQLSAKNGWIDKDGFIYLHFTEKELAEETGVSARTVQNCMNALSEVGLVESVNRGAMKANDIYLLKPDTTSATLIDKGQKTDSTTADKTATDTQNFQSDQQNLPIDTQKFPADTQNLPTSYKELNKKTDLEEVVIAELGKEKLTDHDYYSLIQEFGKEAVDDQINKIKERSYRGCLNFQTIRKWCREARARPVYRSRDKPKNSFHNFHERTYDYDELERVLVLGSMKHAE